MQPQTKKIFDHLEKGKGITSMEAINLYGITRLSAKIYDLKKAGFNIIDQWEDSLNRYGDKVRYKRYFLRSDEVA